MNTIRSRTTRTSRTRWGGTSTRVAIAAILAGLMSIGYAQVSSATDNLPLNITANASSMEQVTINTPTGTRSASTGLFHVGKRPGEGVTGYCVEPGLAGFTFATYKALEPSSYTPANADPVAWEKNQARIAWVLEHSFPQADPGTMLRAAGANLYNAQRVAVGATQLAIWALTGSGVTPGQGTYGSTGTIMDIFKFQSAGARNEGTAVNQVYNYLMQGAAKIGDSSFSGKAATASAAPAFNSTSISQTAGQSIVINGVTYVGPITVTSATSGTVANNISVQRPTLPSADFDFVSLDQNRAPVSLQVLPANTPFYLKVPAGAQPGSVTITAAASASATAGGASYRRILVWKPINGTKSQGFVALDQNGGSVSASATASATASAQISWGANPLPQRPSTNPGTTVITQPNKPTTPSTTPSITTVAQGQVVSGQGGTVADTVNYEGLTGGTWYVLKGQLMDKCTGNRVTRTITSRPFQAAPGGKGAAVLSFTVTSDMMRKVSSTSGCSASLVAFEYLYQALNQDGSSSATGKDPVATHADINSAPQTVAVTAPVRPQMPSGDTPGGGTPTLPRTGVNDSTMSFLVIGLALVAFGAVTALLGRRRRDELGFEF